MSQRVGCIWLLSTLLKVLVITGNCLGVVCLLKGYTSPLAVIH